MERINENPKISLYNGDCIETIKTFPNNSIDAVITDPPYELGFMGKSWDNTGIAYNPDLWREVLRVLKPGGHLLSFGGSRTYHRMACAIEDAGFEIRDQIMWVYGSGFPKSLNIGKAVDKLQGNERELLTTETRYNEPSGIVGVGQGERTLINRKITKGNSAWEGWGTALKPAHEPIVLARKPLSEKTVAENVLKWGVGGINIDGCRVAHQSEADRLSATPQGKVIRNNFAPGEGIEGTETNRPDTSLGRFPANFITDGSEEVVDLFPNVKTGGSNGNRKNGPYSNERTWNVSKTQGNNVIDGLPPFSGSAARFFYCAKASKSERDRGCEGLEEKRSGSMVGNVNDGDFLTGSGNPRRGVGRNNHPTVKPLALMKYLIKLVSREGQLVLEPFGGSGTTAIACKELNRKCIIIEKEEMYIPIIKARVSADTNNDVKDTEEDESEEEKN